MTNYTDMTSVKNAYMRALRRLHRIEARYPGNETLALKKRRTKAYISAEVAARVFESALPRTAEEAVMKLHALQNFLGSDSADGSLEARCLARKAETAMRAGEVANSLRMLRQLLPLLNPELSVASLYVRTTISGLTRN